MAELPECASVDISIHVVSDSTGLVAAVKVGGTNPNNIYESAWSELIAGVCKLLNDLGEVTDARPMTRAEVKLALSAENKDEQEE